MNIVHEMLARYEQNTAAERTTQDDVGGTLGLLQCHQFRADGLGAFAPVAHQTV